MTNRIRNISILIIFAISIASCNKTHVSNTSEVVEQEEENTQGIEIGIPEIDEVEEGKGVTTGIYGKWQLDVFKTFPNQVEKDTALAGAAFYMILDEKAKTSTNILAGVITVFDIEVNGQTITSLKDGTVVSTGIVQKANATQLIVLSKDEESGEQKEYIFNRIE